MTRINYLLGTWSGNRSRTYFDDSYLSRHIRHLNKVKHQLAQISIGYPHNPTERAPYTQFIKSLTTLDNGTPIVVFPVDNNGRSYGQWSRMFNATRDQFTHYIFMEDDYAPCLDYFDQKLVEIFESLGSQNCGYLCGLVYSKEGRYGGPTGRWGKTFGGISNGISSNTVLNKMWSKFGCLPHDPVGYKDGQVIFTSSFEDAGYRIFDYLPHYRCLYYQHSPTLRVYWDGTHNQDLIAPVQYLDKMMDFKFVEYREHQKPDWAMKPPPRTPPNRGRPTGAPRFVRSFQLRGRPR